MESQWGTTSHLPERTAVIIQTGRNWCWPRTWTNRSPRKSPAILGNILVISLHVKLKRPFHQQFRRRKGELSEPRETGRGGVGAERAKCCVEDVALRGGQLWDFLRPQLEGPASWEPLVLPQIRDVATLLLAHIF